MALCRVRVVLAVAAGASLLMVVGCRSAAQTGAVIGALAGAGLGQAIGGSAGGTLIGAAIGGAAGYMMGNEQDRNQAQSEYPRIRQEIDFVTVTITNRDGSISQVRLREQGTGYIDDRGEFYDHLPSAEELRPAYGF
jgi:phage tail tape-measure protein